MTLPRNIPPDGVVTFPEGLPGLDGSRRFLLLRPDDCEPLIMLQSLDDERVSLATIPTQAVVSDYRLKLETADRQLLGLGGENNPASLVSLAVVILPGQRQPALCNLFAPIVINPATKTGKQVLQAGSQYPTFYPLEEE